MSSSRSILIAILVFSTTILSASGVAEETGKRLEMWEEPSHQQVYVDGPAHVLDVRIAPGVTSDYHKHRFATVYVIIQDALVANQNWEEEWTASGNRELRTPGATMDRSDYVENPTYHRVRNEDQRAFHVLAVINERSPVDDNDAPQKAVSGEVIENGWFREHRIKLAPGANSNTLKFANDGVLVQAIGGSSHVIEAGIAHSFKRSPGAFSWHPAGSEFSVANRGEKALELVLLELKSPKFTND